MFRLQDKLLLAFIVVALAAGMTWAFTGRMGGPPQPPLDVPANLAASEVKGRVNVWAWSIAAKALKRVEPDFEKQFPAANVEVDMTGARMQSRLLLALASGVGAPDVSQFEFVDAPRYAATGKLTDLTLLAEKYRDRFPKPVWENCVWNGRVYAIPWDIGPCAVYYKRDIFRKYGIDPDKIETWEEYIAAGKTIVAGSRGRTKMLPLGANSLRPLFEIMIQQNGGQVFDNDGRVAINSPACREVLSILRKMKEAGIGSDLQYGSMEWMAGFNADTIATYPGAVWLAGTIKDSSKDFAGKRPEWGVFKLPAVRPGGLRVANLGGSVLVIPDQCRNKQAAWKFIEYALCTNEGQITQYRAMNLFPAFLPALATPVFDEPDPFFGGQPIGRLFATDVEKIVPLNRTPYWAVTNRYLEQALSQWAAGGMREYNLLATLDQKLRKRMEVEAAPAALARAEGDR